MNKILGKFIIILCVLLCGAQSVGAAAEQSFDVAAEEAAPLSVVGPRQSAQEIIPEFSIMIEEAPDDIRLALFRARCSTAHGRESLMREIARKQETINARAEIFRHHRPVRKVSDISCAEEYSGPNETIRQEDRWEESDHSSDTDDTMG